MPCQIVVSGSVEFQTAVGATRYRTQVSDLKVNFKLFDIVVNFHHYYACYCCRPSHHLWKHRSSALLFFCSFLLLYSYLCSTLISPITDQIISSSRPLKLQISFEANVSQAPAQLLALQVILEENAGQTLL
ncbi:hypothetical protein BCR37DRAFT_218968 [Protomyces lactucae-debilis]|uniref:Uncharacterized protein n=1 Tax=Protomyces lactucae-debilis TaxID=2754530 RepID=A0A1Y2FUK8_PROLT|nr:uncharacterized protein BCR37DRAFT_218968 [Protomyces lactucae-debilis]ORY86375.1 hypothetical protein BCR37DRAFT_218968 [Protomyces lactucae-debilis]